VREAHKGGFVSFAREREGFCCVLRRRRRVREGKDEWGEYIGDGSCYRITSEEGVKKAKVYQVHTTGATGVQAVVDAGVGDIDLLDSGDHLYPNWSRLAASFQQSGANRVPI
jgi:hypothetical protein